MPRITGGRASSYTKVLVSLSCAGVLALSACSSSGGGSGGATNAGAPSGAVPATGAGAASSGGGSSSIAGQSFSLVIDSTPTASKVVEEHAVGLLKAQGVKTSIKFDAASPQVAVARLQRGDIDAYAEAVTGGLSAIISGVKLTDFALAQPRQDYVFITKPSIKSLSDLKGASIGVSSVTGINTAQALLIAQKAGLTKNDVKLQVVGGQSVRAAGLLAGRVDATMLGHIFAAKAEKQGFHVLFDFTKEASNLYDDNVFSTPDWLSKHKDLAIAFNKALLDSFKWFNDPANADAVVAEALKIEPDASKDDTTQLFDTLRKTDAYPEGTILESDLLDQQQKLYAEAGGITKTVPVDQWVDTSYAEAAKAEG